MDCGSCTTLSASEQNKWLGSVYLSSWLSTFFAVAEVVRHFKVGVSFYVGGRVISYGYTGMLFFIWRGSGRVGVSYINVFISANCSRSYSCSGEERYSCRLQILCGDRSDRECHFLIIAASRCQ